MIYHKEKLLLTTLADTCGSMDLNPRIVVDGVTRSSTGCAEGVSGLGVSVPPSQGVPPSGHGVPSSGHGVPPLGQGTVYPGHGLLPSVTEDTDHYTAGIELSNACRSFYVNRVKAAQQLKKRLDTLPASVAKAAEARKLSQEKDTDPCEQDEQEGDPTETICCSPTTSPSSTCKRGFTSIDRAMMALRHELSSLVDQDLGLMKQLLTLNEQIEELKWQRRVGCLSRGSLATSVGSSCLLDSSMCTLTDTEFDGYSRTSLHQSTDTFMTKYPGPSSLSVYQDCLSTADSLNKMDDIGRTCEDISGSDLNTSDLGSSDEGMTSAGELQLTNNTSHCTCTKQDGMDRTVLLNNYTKPQSTSSRCNHRTWLQEHSVSKDDCDSCPSHVKTEFYTQKSSVDSGILQDELSEEEIIV